MSRVSFQRGCSTGRLLTEEIRLGDSTYCDPPKNGQVIYMTRWEVRSWGTERYGVSQRVMYMTCISLRCRVHSVPQRVMYIDDQRVTYGVPSAPQWVMYIHNQLSKSFTCHEPQEAPTYHGANASRKDHELNTSPRDHQLHESFTHDESNESSMHHKLDVSSKHHELKACHALDDASCMTCTCLVEFVMFRLIQSGISARTHQHITRTRFVICQNKNVTSRTKWVVCIARTPLIYITHSTRHRVRDSFELMSRTGWVIDFHELH